MRRHRIDWNDTLGIDKMSDGEFLEKLPELKKQVAKNGLGGLTLGILFVVLMYFLWDRIF